LPEKPAISIVDDDESVREALTGLISSAGYVADAFPSAESFLRSDRLNNTACLIVDMQMPGLTGLELHGHLAASGNPIPTILITAHPDERVRIRALKAGVIAYLIKPFDDGELLACVNSALACRQLDGDDT